MEAARSAGRRIDLPAVDPIFFRTPAELRTRLRNDVGDNWLWIGFYKVASGKRGITYKEALDEALCFGWIDGVRKSLGDESWAIRFSRRKPRSPWSHVNIKRAEELKKMGRMHASGLAAFEGRDRTRDTAYARDESYHELDPAFVERFRTNKKAWTFWEKQPPSYRRVASWWVMSAKKDETRMRRLGTVIDDSAHGRRVATLTPPGKRG